MKPPIPDSPDEAREARLTALLLGELPPDEAAALRAEMEADPALRQVHDQLAQTVSLLREAVGLDAAPQRLAETARTGLLARLRSPAMPARESRKLVPLFSWRWIAPVAVAASLTLLLSYQWVYLRLGQVSMINYLGGESMPADEPPAVAFESAQVADRSGRGQPLSEESLRARGAAGQRLTWAIRGDAVEADGAQRVLPDAVRTAGDDLSLAAGGRENGRRVDLFNLDGARQLATLNGPQPVKQETTEKPPSEVRFYYLDRAGGQPAAETRYRIQLGEPVESAPAPSGRPWGETANGVGPQSDPFFSRQDARLEAAGRTEVAAASEPKDANALVQEGRRLIESGRFDEAEAKLKAALAQDSRNEAASYYARQVEETKAVGESRKRELMVQSRIAEADKDWIAAGEAEAPGPQAASAARKARDANLGREMVREVMGQELDELASGVQIAGGAGGLATNSAGGAFGGFGGGGMGGGLGGRGGMAAGYGVQTLGRNQGTTSLMTDAEVADTAGSRASVNRGFASSFGVPALVPANPTPETWQFKPSAAQPTAGTEIAAGRRVSARAGGASLEGLDFDTKSDASSPTSPSVAANGSRGAQEAHLGLLAWSTEQRVGQVAEDRSAPAASAEPVPTTAPVPPPVAANEAEPLDLRMMQRYGLLPKEALTRAAPEPAVRGRPLVSAPQRDAAAVVAGQAVAPPAGIVRQQPATPPGSDLALAGEPPPPARRQPAAPPAPAAEEPAVERYAGLAEGTAITSNALSDIEESAPALGDTPMVGALFASSLDALAPARMAELQPETAALAETELAPLPLELPIPAFMGTPMDFGDLSTLPRAPGEDESRERLSRGVRKGTAISEAGSGRVGTVTGSQRSESRRLAEATQELAEAEGRPKAEIASLAKEQAETQVEEERLAEVPPPAVGKPVDQLAVVDRAPTRPALPPAEPLPETQTTENPFSTFSLNVADVSFKLAAAALDQGQLPDPAGVRSEEFVNAFDYRDPEPLPGQPVAFVWERARYPFAHNREVMRFALKTSAAGREGGRPLNLVLLLDSSGSMERADRVRILRNALAVLGSELKPEDLLSVVTFSSTATLRANGATGPQAQEALQRATEVPPEGGTNLEEAMQVAYQTARQNYLPDGINRVVVLTDGAANLGNVAAEPLQELVETNRQQGIAFDAFGVGWEGYNDDLLEVLTRNGDGRYGFMNTPEEAADNFAQQLAGALQVAASDVKVQVEFNPARVNTYRQIGYQKHQLTKEQFRDNTVDAAEIGAAEAGNALYVAEINPEGQGPIGQLRVRFRVPATGDYQEREWRLDYAGPAPELDQASPALRLATTAAGFAEWLAHSPYAGDIKPAALMSLLGAVPDVYGLDPRPRQLQQMLQQARSITGL